ncbi:hypothetical protein EC973_002766 [Apophysomyces ossiformis]|uniref:Sphingomyelin phosphodiesterase C-terminal domain-containing protein n=1 Tax=Apophysomyces ossiformis TaxID=679940 RepID=A0A8H7BTE0_9FUNG|nr:hypothetical protein EC973_002766 [Apophysomyces ossiformis]
MQDSFFATSRKRKRTGSAPANKAAGASGRKARGGKPARKEANNRSDESADEDDFEGAGTIDDMNLVESEPESSEEEIEETAAEKRVRLAKAYLENIEEGLEEDLGGFDAADLDRDLIAERLKKDADEMAGKLHRRVADTFDFSALDTEKIQSCRGHQLAVTAVVLADNGSIFYTGSKDGSIIKWDTKTMKKLHTFPGGRKGVKDYVGHTDHILCLALSSDNQYLASGGRDKLINIWSVKDNTHIVAFTQHKDAISLQGLAFRKGSNQLYSASYDRTIKLWNVDERAYIETLFGHQDQITGIDTLGRERCVSTGGRDKSARLWKIPEASQLVYRGGVTTKDKDGSNRPLYVEGSLDCIAQIEENMFVTGGDSGAISLWDINRKKPVFTFPIAHGLNTVRSESEGDINTPHWITAIATLRYSDVFVSGSWDGFVRVWKLASDNKSFSQIAQIPVKGIVNSLQIKTMFPSNRTLLVIGLGQELRIGRWLRLKGTKNCTKAELQAPFSASQLTVQEEEQLYEAAEQLLRTDSIKKSCSSCISLLQIAKKLSYLPEGMLIKALVRVCKRTQKVDSEVCQGEQLTVSSVQTMTVSGRDGHLMCAAVLNSCPYPEVQDWEVEFPKKKPKNYPRRKSKGKTFTVLQLSDWHIDPEYQAGSEVLCDKPICCRSSYTDFSNITKEAPEWGAYTCDTPLKLIESMLHFIPKVEPDIQFGILTGDIPPHEVWSTLPVRKTLSVQKDSFDVLHRHFDSPNLLNTVLYPAVGNHESAPVNIFPRKNSNIPIDEKRQYLDLEWLYQGLLENWRGWLNHHSATDDIRQNTGSYAIRPVKGLKLISLNTNFCYTFNWWLYENPTEKDPNGVLEWLVQQLQDSEDVGERVWIIGHIAPGDITCFHDYSNYYYQIIDRYAPHVIASQFFGHTHKDELEIFYSKGNQRAIDAISVGYIAPSITPFQNINPGFRIYKVDTETFEVVDSITYTADLDQADSWRDGPNWHVEYSARQAYNSPLAPVPATLSPAWWHNVTVAMEEDPETFAKYWYYRTKSSPMTKDCDEECQENTICGIRAGKSELRCDYEPDMFPKGEAQEGLEFKRKRYRPEEHLCGLNLRSVTRQ